MKSLTSKISSLLATFILVILAGLLTVRLQLIDSSFWTQVFDDADIYSRAQEALKYAALNQMETNLMGQGIDIEALSVGERAALVAQSERITEILTVERIQKLADENIKRITNYANGNDNELILYTPFSQWGIQTSTNRAGVTYNEETNLNSLIEHTPNSDLAKNTLSLIHNIKQKSQNMIILLTFALIAVLVLNYRLTAKEVKLMSSANIFLISGLVILAISISLKYFGENLIRSSLYIRDPSKILIGAFVPAFINNVTKLWVIESVFLISLGLIIRLVVTIKIRREKTAQVHRQKLTQIDD